MKRAAVCLSGLVRTFEQTHQNLYDRILAVNPDFNFDFFLSTWANADSRKSTQKIRLERWGHSVEELIPINPTPVDRLNFIYKPVAINIENEKTWDIAKYVSNKDGWASPEAWLGMTYKIADCDRLRRQHQIHMGFIYDVVIRCRFDTLLPIPIDLNIDQTKLYVPKMWAPTYHDQPWTNDMFAIGSD